MSIYYDDNFGVWEGMDDPEMRAFYRETVEKSVLKACDGCGEMVRILPKYAYCDSCAAKRERGEDLYF